MVDGAVPEAGTVLRAHGLSKRFAGRSGRAVDAVHDLSFTVEAGERLAFIGPNAC
jgi:ABC-type multidrug transport system ATPase subunit